MDPHVTSFAVRNDLAEIPRLAAILQEFGGHHALSPRTVNETNVALEEILTNIISYGFDDGAEHWIRVELRLDDRQLTTRVEDDGRPFDPLAAPEPDVSASLEERGVGGLGILLVRKLMDDVRYCRLNGRNVLLMKKSTSPAA